MSGKDSSLAKRKSRRQTNANSEALKSSIENENEDCKRFPYLLRKNCEENGFPDSPQITNYLIKETGQVVPAEQPLFPTPRDYPQEVPKKLLINAYCDQESALKKIICKFPKANTALIASLSQTLPGFSSLFTVSLDYCDLSAEHIQLLANSLKLNSHVKELSLKGNPNTDQNFYLLIDCGLKFLNLKLCQIDKRGLKSMLKEFLRLSPDSTLIHLDLSSNMIFDEGFQEVASILRCDRTLRSMNLSDCKIRDEGFEEIIKSFLKFSLFDEEIFIRRKLRFEYYRLLEKEKESFEKSSIAEKEEKNQTEENDKAYLTILEDKLKRHPFTSDCVQENDEIWCNGNYKLESLNVSYNHLKKPSFDLSLKVLTEQLMLFGTEKGLKRLILDGNTDFNECEDVRTLIEEFLASKGARKSITGSMNKSRVSIKRRKSSAGSSLTTESIKEKEKPE